MAAIYSGKITADQGFNQPEPIAGLSGWTVSKEGQTEIYKITHNLNSDVKVVATPMSTNTVLSIGMQTSTYFTIVAYTSNTVAPTSSAFTFVVIK